MTLAKSERCVSAMLTFSIYTSMTRKDVFPASIRQPDLYRATVLAQQLRQHDRALVIAANPYRPERTPAVVVEPAGVSQDEIVLQKFGEFRSLVRRGFIPVASEREARDAGEHRSW